MYDPKPEDLARNANNFRYHKPHDPTQETRYGLIRAMMEDAGNALLHHCPPSRELAMALTRLEEAMFWANAAIARNERPQ